MNQSGQAIQNDNLQEFLDSAANAVEKGQQQFYTPVNLATSLCRPLPAMRSHGILDFCFGNGSLAAGSGAATAYGIDIDARVKTQARPPKDSEAKWHTLAADFTRWFPIASEVSFKVPYILCNPPFSLKWHASRFAALADSHIEEACDILANTGTHIDSTLATLLASLHMLDHRGEGFLICRQDTAERLFAATGKHPELRRYIWLWLTIPAPVFHNVRDPFHTAVLYFSPSHGRFDRQPLEVTAASADPLAIDSALMVPEVFTAHASSRFRYEFELPKVHEPWESIAKEYRVRHQGAKPDYNIRIDGKGQLRTYLTPFQRASAKIPRESIARLASIDGSTPISLCVTATSRTALREAAQDGVWTIAPDVLPAIQSALEEYEREGAPFYTPNEVQSLGWIDEHSRLECRTPGIGTCQPGSHYTIASTIENTEWQGKRINLVGEEEKLTYTGRELLVTLTDDSGCKHHFHVRKDDSLAEPEENPITHRIIAQHWHISHLVQHFHIPIPKDLATLRPEDYQANLARIMQIQAHINTTLQAASSAA